MANNRNWKTKALILSLDEMPSSHKVATCLVPEESSCYILKATLFGGAKNSLRGNVIPHYTGNLWLYTNPVNSSNKIVDFEATHSRYNIRNSLVRIWLSSFTSELCIKLKGCIDWKLVNAFLDGINISSETECKSTAILRFIWRVASSSGLAPSLSFFEHYKDGTYFDHMTGQFIRESSQQTSYLSTEALEYLYKVSYCEPKEAREHKLSSEAYFLLKNFLFHFVCDIVGEEMQSLSPKNAIYIAAGV
ncbi:MAG: hypothetical protein ACTTKH_05445 [Treponema sp.]